MQFLSSFFDDYEHLLVHFLSELRIPSLVQTRWTVAVVSSLLGATDVFVGKHELNS
jgi:hypothetical protein